MPFLIIICICYVLNLSNKTIIKNNFLKLQSKIIKSHNEIKVMDNLKESSSSCKYKLSNDENENDDNVIDDDIYDYDDKKINYSHSELENITDDDSLEIDIDNSKSREQQMSLFKSDDYDFQSIQRKRNKIFSSLRILTDEFSLSNLIEDKDDDIFDKNNSYQSNRPTYVVLFDDDNSIQYSIASDFTNNYSDSSLSDDVSNDKRNYNRYLESDYNDSDDDDDDDDRPLSLIAQLEPIPSFMKIQCFDSNNIYFNDV